MPPIIAHSLSSSFPNEIACSLIVTQTGENSYLKKIPGIPWLPDE